jgi:methyltransferase (TIGR00027 family)
VDTTDLKPVDEESWDPKSGVGATATVVAAARAMATKDPRGLINDPFAAHLVRAVGIDFFTSMIDPELPGIDSPSSAILRGMVDAVVVRTKYFDDYFADATDDGVRQIVILASGLDTRAYRLPWPTGTVIYEIDHSRVIDFKTKTMAELGAKPTATRHAVAADLRGNWDAELRAAGFQPHLSTAWLAEGVLLYLQGEEQDRLFDTITALSGPGSTVATEYAPGLKGYKTERVEELSRTFRAQGMDIDIPSLMQTGDRSDVVDYLRGKGWKAISVARTDLFIRSDLPLPPADHENTLGEIYYISGTLPDRGGAGPAGRPIPEIGDSGPPMPRSKRGWARRFARQRPTAGHQ